MTEYRNIEIVNRNKLNEAELKSSIPYISSGFLFKTDYEFQYSQEDNGKRFLEHYEQNKALNTTAKKVLVEIASSLGSK